MRDSAVLIDFIDLTLKEKEKVLSWRNHPDIKKWMYNDKDITLKEHLEFIESLKSRVDKRYFLVQQNDEDIGVIDLTNITSDDLEIGLYANPSQRGVGNILMRVIIDYSFGKLHVKKIFAEVFSENSKASHLYQKHGFSQVNKKNMNGKEVLCMELKNENR
ncbi:MAG: UDP-4-amino-4,6-dideoxy-N-acetyl-beta-L-altrosamine N-acetyltransferase [Thiovulaceae bacterium]|nr:UDP-4-amino-4,6-dideoxy-N-acetyl-beta-L-altrosamine N-acetyltransferase [Sulfurimonadaceae bacterium]